MSYNAIETMIHQPHTNTAHINFHHVMAYTQRDYAVIYQLPVTKSDYVPLLRRNCEVSRHCVLERDKTSLLSYAQFLTYPLLVCDGGGLFLEP